MITVRFPSGFYVQYNDLTRIEWVNHVGYLYKDSTSTSWSVKVPTEALIELITPCRTYNPAAVDVAKIERIVASNDLLAKEVSSLKRALAKIGAAR